MSDTERNAKRRVYFQSYAAANRARRREANRRWREKDRLAYNAGQKARNERWRRAHGIQPRPPAKPKPVKAVRLMPVKPKPAPKLISVPRDVCGLTARFAAYRAALKAA